MSLYSELDLQSGSDPSAMAVERNATSSMVASIASHPGKQLRLQDHLALFFPLQSVSLHWLRHHRKIAVWVSVWQTCVKVFLGR
jgi:hypothetical protein